MYGVTRQVVEFSSVTFAAGLPPAAKVIWKPKAWDSDSGWSKLTCVEKNFFCSVPVGKGKHYLHR